MSKINHFRISSILESEIVGPLQFGRGRIEALGDGQRYFDSMKHNKPPSIVHASDEVDIQRIIRVFLAFRKQREDRGSPDLYVADPVRNQQFLAKCRGAAIKVSDYTINKTLLNARKNNYLPGLDSKRTSIDYEDFAFASEFAAANLSYRTGSTIEDILCDPCLAARFDSIAARLSPGRTAFEYRWAVLSIRKAAGRHNKLSYSFSLPELKGRFHLLGDDPAQDSRQARGLPSGGERQSALCKIDTESASRHRTAHQRRFSGIDHRWAVGA